MSASESLEALKTRSASKCPHIAQAATEEIKRRAAAAGCPAHSSSASKGAEKLAEEGKEMCSHARAAIARREAQAAAEAASVAVATVSDIDVHSKEAALDKSTGHAAIKQHFIEAYNDVAGTTKSRGDPRVAAVLMEKLGYTKSELEIIGDDACMMQGTGNPHLRASVQENETVVDLGSGFGIDAFVSATKVGEQGEVIGVDISAREVNHARQRAHQRGMHNVTFREGDIEDLPLKDGFADCVTSNGGFCLVPDKPRAFKEIFRVLKPGGRMAVCCTTKRKKLPEGVDWPVCMNVFMMLDECAPMLEDIGFEAIDVDASNARMDLWDLDAEDVREVINGLDPEEKAKYTPEKYEERRKESSVHSGSERFKHLQDFDMNELCARVVIYAQKPKSQKAAGHLSIYGGRTRCPVHQVRFVVPTLFFGVAAFILGGRSILRKARGR